jgi:hypothetical protein
MQFLGTVTVPAGGSANNVGSFAINEKFTSLLIQTPPSTAGFHVVVSDSVLTSDANQYLLIANTFSEVKCPNGTANPTIVAIYSSGSGGVCAVYGLFGTALIDATSSGGGGGGGVTSITGGEGITVDSSTGNVTLGSAAGGDLSGTVAAATVVGLQNVGVASIAPTNGQVLAYHAGSGKWEPTSGAGGGLPYSEANGVTTTATPSITLYSVALPLNTVADLDIKIVAIENSTSAYARFERRVFVSNATGTASLDQSLVPTPDKKSALASAWTATVGVSAANLQVTVTGVPSSSLDTVKWEAIIVPTELTY